MREGIPVCKSNNALGFALGWWEEVLQNLSDTFAEIRLKSIENKMRELLSHGIDGTTNVVTKRES